MRFTLRQLEYFLATAETGSIKDAAARISISAPSISSAIAHLEDSLGLQLFVRRHARGLQLTPSGRRMAREAKLLLRQAEGLHESAGELRNETRGRLAVGCMLTLAPMIAPELVRAFTARYPDVELSIEDTSHERLIERLRLVHIDAAISYDLHMPDGIAFEPLASLPPYVQMAAEHPLAREHSLSLEVLADEPLVLLDLPYSQQYFTSIFSAAGLTPNIVARCSSVELVRSMVANGLGYSIWNTRPKNERSLDGRKLASVALAGPHRPLTIGLATLAEVRTSAVLGAFAQHCRDAFSASAVAGMRAPIDAPHPHRKPRRRASRR